MAQNIQFAGNDCDVYKIISHSTVVLCIKGWPWFGQHYSVLKEILMFTFGLWCRGLLTN